MRTLLAPLAALLLSAVPARAYVDPGIVGSLYQLVYVAVFGVLLGYLCKPLKAAAALWERARAALRRRRGP